MAYSSSKTTFKEVIWIVASRSEPFSKIRHALIGSTGENLDSKKPPQRLVLQNCVLRNFITYLYQPY